MELKKEQEGNKLIVSVSGRLGYECCTNHDEGA